MQFTWSNCDALLVTRSMKEMLKVCNRKQCLVSTKWTFSTVMWHAFWWCIMMLCHIVICIPISVYFTVIILRCYWQWYHCQKNIRHRQRIVSTNQCCLSKLAWFTVDYSSVQQSSFVQKLAKKMYWCFWLDPFPIALNISHECKMCINLHYLKCFIYTYLINVQKI